MPVSQPARPSATPNALSASKCDECGQTLAPGHRTYLPGFGNFHPDCVKVCPCSWAWPASLVETGDVALYCGACARRSL